MSNLTPKEKAKELVIKFVGYTLSYRDEYAAKQCALIAVDLRLDGDFIFTSIEYGKDSLEYWEQVKQEIELL